MNIRPYASIRQNYNEIAEKTTAGCFTDNFHKKIEIVTCNGCRFFYFIINM